MRAPIPGWTSGGSWSPGPWSTPAKSFFVGPRGRSDSSPTSTNFPMDPPTHTHTCFLLALLPGMLPGQPGAHGRGAWWWACPLSERKPGGRAPELGLSAETLSAALASPLGPTQMELKLSPRSPWVRPLPQPRLPWQGGREANPGERC